MSATASSTRPFSELLRAPGVARVASSGLVARLPLGMNTLALVLLVRASGGSYALAGAVSAAMAGAEGLTTPALARLVDRVGQPRVLLPLVALYPASLAALVVLVRAGAPPAALVACAIAMGATLPPIAACIRTLWPVLAPRPELRTTAFALEATLQEVFFLVGPLLVALVATAASPTAALALSGAAGALGTLVFATSPASRRGQAEPAGAGRRGSPLASAGVRTVALASLAIGVTFGTIEVSMPAFAEAHGWREGGGVALAAHAFGSLAGGLWTGSRPSAARPARRFALALGAYAAGLALLQLAGSIPAMALLAFVAGVPIAPAFAAAYALVDDTAPAGTATEAFAWLSTAIVIGLAAGTAAAGALVEQGGTSASLGLGCGAALVALALSAHGGGRSARGRQPPATGAGRRAS